MPTTRDDGGELWRLTDDVIRLRLWGTSQIHDLPNSTARELSVGSGRTAWMRLQDGQGRVSSHHADLLRKGGKWVLRDSGSTNGIVVEGRKCSQLMLEPAQEILIGGVTLVAESYLSIGLRSYLCRILGWDNERAVDIAMRSFRVAAKRETALVLTGSDELVSIAHALHCRGLGPERPFVCCAPSSAEPGSRDNVAQARGFTTAKDGMSGMRSARNGSLCFFVERLPRDFSTVRRAFQEPDTRVMLVLCAKQPPIMPGVAPIEIPPLSSRTSELRRIVMEYVVDAQADFGVSNHEFPSEYVDWIVARETETLAHVERAAQRVLAVHVTNSVNAASKLVNIARQTLAYWIKKHGLPAGLENVKD